MRKLLASLLAVAAMFTVFTFSVSAATPGYSDYEVTKTVVLSTVAGDKVELTSTESKTVVSIAKTALPERVTSVIFAAKEIDKTSDTYVAAKKLAEKSGFKNAVLFDFKLLDQNNAPIEKLNGKISVTVACPKGVNTVLYYNDKDGTITNLGGTVKMVSSLLKLTISLTIC